MTQSSPAITAGLTFSQSSLQQQLRSSLPHIVAQFIVAAGSNRERCGNPGVLAQAQRTVKPAGIRLGVFPIRDVWTFGFARLKLVLDVA